MRVAPRVRGPQLTLHLTAGYNVCDIVVTRNDPERDERSRQRRPDVRNRSTLPPFPLSRSDAAVRFLEKGTVGRTQERSTVNFETEFELHHAALFRYLHRLSGDGDVAADLAQESFVRLMDHDLPAEQVRSWLFTVATNLLRDRARTRGRRSELLRKPAARPRNQESPEDRVARLERVESVREALAQLPARDREMLLMREEGFRYAEIAEVVGVSASSVGTLLARALRRFEEAYRPAPAAGQRGEWPEMDLNSSDRDTG